MDEYFELLRQEIDYVVSAVEMSEDFSLTCGDDEGDVPSTMEFATTLDSLGKPSDYGC